MVRGRGLMQPLPNAFGLLFNNTNKQPKAAPNDPMHIACGVHCMRRRRFKLRDRQTLQTSVRMVGISCIRCSLKMIGVMLMLRNYSSSHDSKYLDSIVVAKRATVTAQFVFLTIYNSDQQVYSHIPHL